MSKITWKVESYEIHTPSPYTLPAIEVGLIGNVDGCLPKTSATIGDIMRDVEDRLNGPVKPTYVPYSEMSSKYYIRNDAEPTVQILPDLSHIIKNVIFNDPATIVFWHDGTKTVVKCGEGDIFDPEKGLAMAISKKFLGNQGNYYNEIKKWVGKYDVEPIYPESKYINFPLSNDLKKAFEAIIDKRIASKNEKEWKK